MGGVNPLDQTLEQLKDIHMPAPEAWYHLPLGWWLVLGALLILAMMATIAWPHLKRRHQRTNQQRALRQSMTQALEKVERDYAAHHDAQVLLSSLSILLRRITITLFESQHTAGLIQTEWLQFLDSQWHGVKPSPAFSDEPFADLLTHAAYRPNVDENMNSRVEALLQLTREWVHHMVKAHV